MTQSKEELDLFHQLRDPWAYQTTPDDVIRKQHIIHMLELYRPYSRVLDIGAGEGWITKELPAPFKYAYELSDVAASRLPNTVTRVTDPIGPYDLVLATGVLYHHYDWRQFVDMIKRHASHIILTCNIKSWEHPSAIAEIPGRQILDMEFPYREFTQKLRIFDLRP